MRSLFSVEPRKIWRYRALEPNALDPLSDSVDVLKYFNRGAGKMA